MRHLGLIVLLVAMFVATLPPRAWAHNAQVTALINLGVPHPGQASPITIELLDVLGGDIPDAKVRVLFETSSERVINTSTLVGQGTKYQGNVSVPAPGAAIFRLEVTLVDGLYAVQFPVQIQENAEVLPGAVFELYHSDTGAPASPGAQPQPKPQPQPAPSTPPAQAPAPTGTPPAAASQAQRSTEEPAQTAPTAPQPTPTTSAPGQSAGHPAAAATPAAPAGTPPAVAAESRYAIFPWVMVAAGVMLLISGSTFPRQGRH